MRKEKKTKWSSEDILELLQKIDEGYEPTPAENEVLGERKSLHLSGVDISSLPESIGLLTALQELVLSDTRITALPESIGGLTELQVLVLSYTKITALPESTGRLTALQNLNLSGTGITALPESIVRLTELQVLYLFGTKITALPDSIGRLAALQTLNLNFTGITALPDSIVRLTALQILDLCGTKITALPETIGQIRSLERLDIGYTQITELPDWIGELPNLKWLYLSGLKLKRIPKSIALKGLPFTTDIFASYGIGLRNTVLEEQNISIFLETPELIPSLYEDEQVLLKECKVIFLGDGGAGKSYTIKRLKADGRKESPDNPYVTTVTHGVEISDWKPEGEDGLTIHLWDFGGQDVMHSMHRCFLTEKTCYIVMIDSRRNDGDKRADYWLRNIRAFAPDSPVLLFVNCWEDGSGEGVIDENGLLAGYGEMIKRVIYCSAMEADDEEFRAKIMDAIAETVAEAGFGRQTIPPRYYNARKRIGGLSDEKPFLTKQEYHKLCRDLGIEDENASPLLTFFNNIGVCFSYHMGRDRRELEDYRLLKPVWLTNAVYAIIEEGRASAYAGTLTVGAISQLLCNEAPSIVDGKQYKRVVRDMKYEDVHIGYILAVAEAYELCYVAENDRAFFPALLSSNSPKEANEYTSEYPNRAEYRFIYEYLPDSVVHRLMIRFMKKDIAINSCWLKGMVLGAMGNHKAIIRMFDERTLRVEVLSKDGKPASELFPLIRREIIGVNEALGISSREAVASGEDVFTVISLLNTYKKGDNRVFGDKTGKEQDAFKLLNSFYDAVTINGMNVDERGRIKIETYNCCEQRKSKDAFRKAIYHAYNKKCAYCGEPIKYSDMQIDHILATRHVDPKDAETRMYLAELAERGLDLEKPDFIENYLPSCRHCNGSEGKSNRIFEIGTLRFYHDLALQHTPEVIRLLEQYDRELKEE